MRMYRSLTIVLLTVATLYATAAVFGAGLPPPQDVMDQLKTLYPNATGAEILPKGDQFEVLFLSSDPEHILSRLSPMSCLVDVATHRVSKCHYVDLAPENCSCTRIGKETLCNNACRQPATPAVIAALRNRYPDLQSDKDVTVFDDANHHYEVTFYTRTGWHISCRLTLNPIRISNCRVVHA